MSRFQEFSLHRQVPTFIAALIASLFSLSSQAQSPAPADEVLALVVGQRLAYDSNVFRVSDGENPAGFDQRHDMLWTSSLRGELNKSFGRQRVYGDLGAAWVKYQEFGHLDHQTYQGFLAWRAGFGAGSEAGAFYRRNRSMSSFDERTGFSQRNMLTAESYGGDVMLRVAGDWLGVSSLSRTENSNSQEVLKSGENDILSWDAGVRYAPRSGNVADLRYRRSRYEYNRVSASDYSYDQDEIRLSGRWVASGRSTLDAGVSLLRSRHDQLDNLDFTGLAGYVVHTYRFTGASQVVSRVFRDVGAVGDGWGSYAKTTGISIMPSWQASAKLKVFGEASWRERDFKGYQAFAVAGSERQRTDKIRLLSVGASHALSERFDLRLELRDERRDSSLAGYDFTDQQALLTAEYRFQ